MSASTSRFMPATLMLITGAFLVGCSVQSEIPPAPGAEQSTAATKGDVAPLTTAQLKALTFKEGEVPQARAKGIAVTVRGSDSDGPSFKPASDADCQTVIEVQSGKKASAVVDQIFNWEGGIYPAGSTLSAYDSGKARRYFSELKKALRSCGTFEADSWTGKITATMRAEKAPDVGDEAVRFRVSNSVELGKRQEQITVVRVGDVIVAFSMLDIGASPSFPESLIIKQVDRLHDAQLG